MVIAWCANDVFTVVVGIVFQRFQFQLSPKVFILSQERVQHTWYLKYEPFDNKILYIHISVLYVEILNTEVKISFQDLLSKGEKEQKYKYHRWYDQRSFPFWKLPDWNVFNLSCWPYWASINGYITHLTY